MASALRYLLPIHALDLLRRASPTARMVWRGLSNRRKLRRRSWIFRPSEPKRNATCPAMASRCRFRAMAVHRSPTDSTDPTQLIRELHKLRRTRGERQWRGKRPGVHSAECWLPCQGLPCYMDGHTPSFLRLLSVAASPFNASAQSATLALPPKTLA